jgi:hypothetical protein
MARNASLKLLIPALLVPALDLQAGPMYCEILPPTCWLCEHYIPGGFYYDWEDNPLFTGQFDMHINQPWYADYHCYNPNYPYTIILYSDRKDPTPIVTSVGGVQCGMEV